MQKDREAVRARKGVAVALTLEAAYKVLVSLLHRLPLEENTTPETMDSILDTMDLWKEVWYYAIRVH